MSEAKGVKETKELISLGIALEKAVVAAKADGKIDINDLPLLLAVLPKLQPAIDGIDQIPAELKDLSAPEAADVVAYVMAELAIGEGKAKEVALKAVALGVAALDLFRTIQAPAA